MWLRRSMEKFVEIRRKNNFGGVATIDVTKVWPVKMWERWPVSPEFISRTWFSFECTTKFYRCIAKKALPRGNRSGATWFVSSACDDTFEYERRLFLVLADRDWFSKFVAFLVVVSNTNGRTKWIARSIHSFDQRIENETREKRWSFTLSIWSDVFSLWGFIR